ncbi:MAG: ABC transporter permease [Thermofilaceae archaeon]
MHPLISYAAKRILTYLLTLFIVVTITFLLFRLIPGDPISSFVGQLQAQGRYAEAEKAQQIIEEYKRMFGLDKDLFSQYILFLKELLRGNLGPSLIGFPRPAQDLIMERLPWTIGLLGISAVIAWALGLVLGCMLGWKRDSAYDKAFTTASLVLSQIPYYLMAVILVLIFTYYLKVLPSGGAYSPKLTPGLYWEFIKSVIEYGTLPALSLIVASGASWLVSSRFLTVTILAEDYLHFAEAKGLKTSRIIKRYILRNALLPQITGLSINLSFMLGGQIVLETIFSYPGIGYLFATAIGLLDYNVINGVLLLIIFTALTANFILDLLYPLIDPRVRYHG